jgi:hypothetical protein
MVYFAQVTETAMSEPVVTLTEKRTKLGFISLCFDLNALCARRKALVRFR